MKKILSLILAVCMLCGFLETSVYAAYDKEGTTVTYGGKTLPIGNYKDGKRYTDTFGGATQCLGFAFYSQNKLFGFYYKNTGNLNGDKFNVKKGNNGNNIHVYSVDETKSLFKDVTLGAHIRTGKDVKPKKGKQYSHSMIFMKSDNSYIWTYEGNADGNYGVYVVKRTWEEMYNYLTYKKNGVIYIASPKSEYYTGAASITNKTSNNANKKESTLKINIGAYPTTINKGKAFNLTGKVTSNYKLTSVNGYILSSDGKAIIYAGYDKQNKYSVDIQSSVVNKNLLFDKLEPGSYIYKVTAWDESGANRIFEKTFTVKGNTTNTTTSKKESTLSINIGSYPTTINKGKAFNLTGTVTSNYKLTSVNGYILSSDGKTILYAGYDKQNKYSVDIQSSVVNKNLLFDKLESGTYIYKVTAWDESGANRIFEKTFTVKGNTTNTTTSKKESTLSINIGAYPTTINKGKAFNLTGTVTSNYKLTSVNGYILSSDGETIIYAGYDKQNKYSVDIQSSVVNKNLLFNKLPKGSYIYKVTAWDESGENRIFEKKFTVK